MFLAADAVKMVRPFVLNGELVTIFHQTLSDTLKLKKEGGGRVDVSLTEFTSTRTSAIPSALPFPVSQVQLLDGVTNGEMGQGLGGP